MDNGRSPGSKNSIYTLEALRYAEENWPFVKLVAIWAFRYPAATKSYMDYYTLITPEFINKPLYDYIKAFATGTGAANVES